jgi:hypothetical protein
MDLPVERIIEDWPRVMIAMPAKNDAEWLPACLGTLLRMDYPHGKLRFVLGYGQSTDETRRIIEETLAASDVVYEILDEPETTRPVKSALYLADTMNLLQSQLRDEDYILYADADVVEVPKNLLKELIRAEKDIVAPCPMMESEPGRFVFYDTYVFRDLQGRNFTRVQRNPDHPWLKGVRPVEMMSIGTMSLVRRRVAQEVRWDNPVPWLQYCLNAREKGFRVWALPFVRVHHAPVYSELGVHISVEEFVRRGVLPSSELGKVQTLRGRFWLQERFFSCAGATAFGIARFLAQTGLRFAPRPTAFLIREFFPPARKQVQQFRDIARQSRRLSPVIARTPQDTSKTILYAGTHPILAYEECTLLHELGYTVLNIFPFLESDAALAERGERPLVPPDFECWLERAKDRLKPEEFNRLRSFNYRRPLPPDLAELIEREIDTIIVVNDPLMIRNLIGFASRKRFIVRLVQHQHGWYALGMFNDFFVFPSFFVCPDTEEERALTPDIASRLTVLPAHVDEKRLRPYTGEIPAILSACSNMTNWPKQTRLEEFKRCVEGFPHLLTGPGNSNYPGALVLKYEDYIDALGRYRVHLSNGYGRTAKYALNGFIVESMLCGAPVATLSNLALRRIFDNKTNGFCSDNIPWLRKRIKQLLEDLDYARFIGKNGQELARRLWSKDRARKCWQFILCHTREESIAWLREERKSGRVQ